jgi:hypothetical protein
MHGALAGLRRWPVAVVALLALAVASVSALAAAGDGSTISSCVKKKGGSIRIVRASTRCRRNERKLAWNTIGPAGPRGLRGFTGGRGATGATGSAGAAGAAGVNGAANGFVDTNPPPVGERLALSVSEKPSVVATLKLPAGHYVVQADVHVARAGVTEGTKVTCHLEGNGEVLDQSAIDVTSVEGTSAGDLSLGGGLALTAAGMAQVSCTPVTGERANAGAKIIATQVTTVTSTTG